MTILIKKLGPFSASVEGRCLYSDITIELKENQWLKLSGPNGSGKTTLITQIIKALQTNSFLYLPQIDNKIPHVPLTLEEYLTLKTKISGKKLMASLKNFFPHFNERCLKSGWSHASGGERKLTLLFSLLIQNPKILILDEPFNHLDKQVIDDAFWALKTWTHQSRGALILTSHITDINRHLDFDSMDFKELTLNE